MTPEVRAAIEVLREADLVVAELPEHADELQTLWPKNSHPGYSPSINVEVVAYEDGEAASIARAIAVISQSGGE